MDCTIRKRVFGHMRTARALICPRVCPKTRFRMARPVFVYTVDFYQSAAVGILKYFNFPRNKRPQDRLNEISSSTFLEKKRVKENLESTLVVSKSKGLYEILLDIRNSTYQIYKTEEKLNNLTTTFHKRICNLIPEVRDTLKLLWKRGEIAPKEQVFLLSTILCYLFVDFHV